MNSHHDGETPEGWIPLPSGFVFHERRVVTRAAFDETLAWFPLPDPSGYAGIGMSLMDKMAGPREHWMWTDESGDRVARIIRLGYQRIVVELHGEDVLAVLEHTRQEARAKVLTPQEQDVLGRDTVLSTQIIPSGVIAESCASMWIGHGSVHNGFSLAQWKK